MAASEPQVFLNISPAQYAALVEKAAAAGIALKGNSGTASQYGVEVAWNYAPDSGRLTIQCLKDNIFMSAKTIDARIKAMVEQTAG